MARIPWILLVLAALSWSAIVQADQPPAAGDAAALLKQLVSRSLDERAAAEKRLKALGGAALPALIAAVGDSDTELATRCNEIAHQIRHADLDAFLAGKKGHVSPAWKPFAELVGDSAESRKLFVELVAHDDRAAEV